MGKETKIQWCDSTVNPVHGCGGCELWTANNRTCYAGEQTERFGRSNPGMANEFTKPELKPGKIAECARFPDLSGTERLEKRSKGKVKYKAKPWLNGLPRHIFVSDMGDALTEKGFARFNGKPVNDIVLFNYLKQEILDVVRSDDGARHQWLWLTKRPNRLHQFVKQLRDDASSWPRNLWVGTSVTSMASMTRVSQLCAFGDQHLTRFVSVEPLWEEVSLKPFLHELHWVIIGGESGRKRNSKPFDCHWARQLIDECHAANVPVFVKQIGGNPVDGDVPFQLQLDKSHGGDWSEWPTELRLRQMPVARIHVPSRD